MANVPMASTGTTNGNHHNVRKIHFEENKNN
jgi:hypothetical protein